MTTSKVNAIVQIQLNECKKVFENKTAEYNLESDRLAAFKLKWLVGDAGNAKMVLWGQLVKHLDSIYEMSKINSNRFDFERQDKWNEKITDVINYMCLLKCIINENSDNYVLESKVK